MYYICAKYILIIHHFVELSCNAPQALLEGNTYYVPWTAYSASSEYYEAYEASFAYSGWSSNNRDSGWLQVDLGAQFLVAEILTKGTARSDNEWVTSYKVRYQESMGSDMVMIRNADDTQVVFSGNWDKHTLKTNVLPEPIVMRIIRIVVHDVHDWASMRLEVKGCPV